MKWSASQLNQALKKGVESLPPLILIYGDDGGLVHKLSKAAAQAVCPTDDPFMVNKLSVLDLKTAPSLLQESAQTLGFGEGRKLITLEANHLDGTTQGTFTAALKSLLQSLKEGENSAVVVVTASGLEAKQAIAKAATAHGQAAAVRCFLDGNRDLNTVINEKLQQSGQKIAPDGRQFLLDALGRDRGITESELDKLVLYTKGQPEITLKDCLEVVAAAPSVTVFKLCDAIGLRDRQQADKILQQLQHEGAEANMMLALIARHLRRLQACHNLCAEGLNPTQAMAKLRPPVFMGKDEFQQQLRRTSSKRVGQSLGRLYTLQEQSRKGVTDAADLIHRGLLALSA